MIIVTGSLGGIYAVKNLSERLRFLEEYEKFITVVETEIRYRNCCIPEIISNYSGESLFSLCLKSCIEYINNNVNLESAWRKSFSIKKYTYVITDEQKKMIIDFGLGLGTSDLEGQISHCNYYQKLVQPHIKSAEEDKKIKGKLYISLGTCLGIAIALLLI